MALKLPPTLNTLSRAKSPPLCEWGESFAPVSVVTAELTSQKGLKVMQKPFQRIQDRIPTTDNAIDRYGTAPPSTSPGPMINIWNKGKIINVFAPSGVFKKRKAAQKYKQVVGHNSKPLPPTTPLIGTAQRWLPPATESPVHRQTRSRLGTSSSDRKQPTMTPDIPRPHTEMHGSKMRGSKMNRRQQSRRMQRAFAPEGGGEGLGLSRPFELWPRARQLVAAGRATEAIPFFDRARRLVAGRVPASTLAQLACEMADAALKAAQEGNIGEEKRARFYKQVEREASTAIVHFDESSSTPYTDQTQHRSGQMKAYAYLLRATSALGIPTLDKLMQDAASLLVDDRNYEHKNQVAGHETLVKALVSVLFEQGRHDEALEWKKFSQEIVTNHNRDTPSRGTTRDVHNFAQTTAF